MSNRALGIVVVVLAALGVFWWRERTRHYDAPRWPLASFAALAPVGGNAPPGRWIVAVNPDCPHCRARLADLERRDAARAAGAALGVLVVDTPRRPRELELGPNLEAGVWWDSLGAWRSRWGHRVYGETLVFGPDGALVRVLAPAEDVPAAQAASPLAR